MNRQNERAIPKLSNTDRQRLRPLLLHIVSAVAAKRNQMIAAKCLGMKAEISRKFNWPYA